MKNEYGEALDRNGYSATLWPDMDGCGLCGWQDRPLQRHEVFHGPYREKSKRYGCWVTICDVCHSGIHQGGKAESEKRLKYIMQRRAMKHYGWTEEQFRAVFGKSYQVP